MTCHLRTANRSHTGAQIVLWKASFSGYTFIFYPLSFIFFCDLLPGQCKDKLVHV